MKVSVSYVEWDAFTRTAMSHFLETEADTKRRKNKTKMVGALGEGRYLEDK